MVYIIIYRDMKNRKDKKYVIYEHISPSGKVYVGQSSEVNIRWQGGGNRYLSKNKKGKYVQPYFANALLKYGWENFGHKIILSGLDKSNANYAEKYLIKWYKLKGLSYNITDGGEGGCGLKRTMSPEMRIFMSNYMRKYSPLIGTHRTERQKQMAREKMMGRHPTKEARIKMSEAHVNKANFWRWKKIYAFDKETKEFVREYDSVSKAAKELGLYASAIVSSAKGRCPSAGSYIWSYTPYINKTSSLYNKMNYSKVYCYTLDGKLFKIYNSIKEAAQDVDGNIHCISNCCNGRALSHKNFIWRKELETIDTKIIEKLLKNNVA